MKKLVAVVFLLGLLLKCQASEFNLQVTHIDSSGFPEINALIRVYSDQAFEMQPENLQIFENEQQVATLTLKPQNFDHFISLVIDRSSSIESAMNKVKAAAAGFVKSLVGEVSFSIVSFGSDIDFNHDFSRDQDSLIEAIKKIRPWGGTLLYDAIYDACEDLQAKADLNDLKTVLCITDGKDSTPSGQTQLSMHSAEETAKYAVDKSIRVVAIGLGAEIDPLFLSSIASSTGGWFLKAESADQLADLCRTMSDRIRRRRHYLIQFKTPDGKLTSNARTVTVKASLPDRQTSGSRPYHPPNSMIAAAGNQDPVARDYPLDELFEEFNISYKDQDTLLENVRIPHPEPVYGLTLASFERASSADCRILINKAREQSAKQHQSNLANQQKFIRQYLLKIDKHLQNMFKIADDTGTSQLRQAKASAFIRFLELRREELVILNQQAYEIYLVSLKASLDELEYYDKTQVMGQDTNPAFFDTNASVKATALAAVKNKFSQKLEEIRKRQAQFQNQQQLFKRAEQTPAATASDSAIPIKRVD
ncbi:MAG: VWA domain-containing protein [Candidatus Riflebacteria bacterium]